MRYAVYARRLQSRIHKLSFAVFFFNDTATTEIYTLSLHDALPISPHTHTDSHTLTHTHTSPLQGFLRSEEHTSELQSHLNLVCRRLLEKKKITASDSDGSNSPIPCSSCSKIGYLV